MELKPGYKQTEVGVIPEDWTAPTIKAIIDELSMGPFGSDIKVSNFLSSGVPVLNGANVAHERLTDSFENFVSPVKAKSLKKAVARRGDVVVTHRGTIGQISFIHDDSAFDRYVISQSQFRARFDVNIVMPPWVVLYFHSELGAKKLLEGKGHTGVPAIAAPTKTFRNLSIPIPPLAEQSHIVKAWEDADAFIESLEQLLIKKRQVKQGVMHELLTGNKRLPGFKQNGSRLVAGSFGMMPDDWKPTSLQNVSAFITKGATPTTYGYVWQQEGIPFLRSECVSEAGLDLSQSMFISHQAHQSLSRSRVVAGDLLITITGNVGRCVRLEGEFAEANINQHIARIRIVDENVSEQFVLYFLSQSTVRRYYTRITTGQAYPQLSLVQIRETEIPLPTHAEQVAIAEVLSGMDAEIIALEAKVVKARHIKQGMMQELLTGRIRLVRPTAQILSFPAKESASATDISHNTHFNEAVVIAVLSAKFGSETFPLGRFRRTKFSYLLHRHVEHEAAGFMKKAAGPYNPRTRYGGAEKIALQNRYVRVLSTGKSEGFVADENIAQAESYFEKWYGAEALTWLEQFRYQKNDALELLTTVDMACEDLSRMGKAATLSAVKQIIHDSPEWKAKLNRAVFSDDNIATTIQSCGQLFPIEEE